MLEGLLAGAYAKFKDLVSPPEKEIISSLRIEIEFNLGQIISRNPLSVKVYNKWQGKLNLLPPQIKDAVESAYAQITKISAQGGYDSEYTEAYHALSNLRSLLSDSKA